MNKDHCIITYHSEGADDNALATTIKTLRMYSECFIYIFTDDMPVDRRLHFSEKWGVHWRMIDRSRMEGRRAMCKVEDYVCYCRNLPEGQRVMIADADLYFLENPFVAFDEIGPFDIGITVRGYDYWTPINGGVIYVRVTNPAKEFLEYHRDECLKPSWDEYIHFRKKFDHEKHGLDWTVGQDFLSVAYNHKELMEDKFDVFIEGVSNAYNYCPAVDKFGFEKARSMIMEMYHRRFVATLHLKSELKDMLYTGDLKDAVTIYERGKRRWK